MGQQHIRLLVREPHHGMRPVYIEPTLVAALRKDADGRALITAAGHNISVEAPGLRKRMKVGNPGGALERDFLAVNFVKVAELLGIKVAKADKPDDAAAKAEPVDIKEPAKK
jgi:hypothetical protein